MTRDEAFSEAELLRREVPKMTREEILRSIAFGRAPRGDSYDDGSEPDEGNSFPDRQ